MQKSVLIVGYGVVGSHLHNEIKNLNPDIYDKFKGGVSTKRNITYDFAFICVDTPYIDENNPCEISGIKDALVENDAKVYIIKSTILPRTTEALQKEFPNKHILFSPEYYGGTQHCNNFTFDFTILGGHKDDCLEVQQLLQEVYDARHTFHIVDSVYAEMAKYMENSWIYYKVRFCIEWAKACKKVGIDYEPLRELFILDKGRVNPSHTYVYKDHPYVQSHCMDKDVPAIAHYLDLEFLQDVIRLNEQDKMWDNITTEVIPAIERFAKSLDKVLGGNKNEE